jgi:hypothetical protein
MTLPGVRRSALGISVLLLGACGGTPEPAGTPGAPPAGVLINEVRFLPGDDAPAFIELVNVGSAAASLDATVLRSAAGTAIELPAGLALAPGAMLEVRFDDAAPEPSAGRVHLPAASFAGGEAGELRLEQAGTLVDAVAWGRLGFAALDLCRGGRCETPAPGSVIARLPNDARAFQPAAWAPLDAELATPGIANLRPRVARFALLPGTIFAAAPRFSWYSVPGASRYRLEVARDESFAPLVHEAVVEATPAMRLEQLAVAGPELPSGSYVWRVQAIDADGVAAAPSRPMPFSVDSSRAVSAPFDSQAVRAAAAATPAGPAGAAPPADESILKVLDVPIIRHAKDTRMLALEARSEGSPGSWDTPDSANYPYCARAGVAMVNAYYNGKLSQDRIGYEANKSLRDGPEYDLPINGIDDANTSEYSLPLAIGNSGVYFSNPFFTSTDSAACYLYRDRLALERCAAECVERDTETCSRCRIAAFDEIGCPSRIAYPAGFQAYEHIRQEIDAGRPIIATSPGHLFLIVGYRFESGDFSIFYQDEGGRREVLVDPAWLMGELSSYWIGLVPVAVASDEPEVSADSDGDGIVDFDEIHRFETDENDPDTDGDGIDDKKEVRSSVWDPQHGYHRSVRQLAPTDGAAAAARAADLAGRDFDRDGRPMEADADSDGGACRDGAEDVNFNGVRDGRESYNFDPGDDDCDVALGGRIEMTYGFVPAHPPACKGTVRIRLKFELQPVPGTLLDGSDVALAYEAHDADLDISSEGCLDIVGGTFDFWGGANVACNAGAQRASRVIALGPETTSSLQFLPLEPALSLALPTDALLNLRGDCRYVDGRTSDYPVELVGSEFLNVRSGPSCETSERYQYGQGPGLLDFCVTPTVCNSVVTASSPRAECFTQPARHAAIPFSGSATKLGEILEGSDIGGARLQINVDDAQVRWEICRGCGEDFFE